MEHIYSYRKYFQIRSAYVSCILQLSLKALKSGTKMELSQFCQITIEPGHSISYKVPCATGEDSDHPAHHWKQ